MCQECLTYPCHPRCPNSDDPPVVCKCEECDEEIYEGDQYFHIGEHNFCESCGRGGYRTAEKE